MTNHYLHYQTQQGNTRRSFLISMDVGTLKPPVSMYNLLNWSTLYRGYNALVAGLMILQYFSNPNATAAEYLPDVAIHALEAIDPESLKDFALIGNMARGLQAGYAFFSGDSTMPPSTNIVDVANHGINFAHRLVGYRTQP